VLWATIVHIKIDRKAAIYVLLAFSSNNLVVYHHIAFFQVIPKNLHEDWLMIISSYEVFLFGYVLAKIM